MYNCEFYLLFYSFGMVKSTMPSTPWPYMNLKLNDTTSWHMHTKMKKHQKESIEMNIYDCNSRCINHKWWGREKNCCESIYQKLNFCFLKRHISWGNLKLATLHLDFICISYAILNRFIEELLHEIIDFILAIRINDLEVKNIS